MKTVAQLICFTISIAMYGNVYSATASGTGFFVSSNGYLVTNYHVVSDAKLIKVRDSTGNILSARVIAVDASNDLAILKVDGVFEALPIGTSKTAKPGTKVVTMGFPHVDIQGVEPKVSEGIVSSTTGIANDPRAFQISAPVQSGNSGGPLVTMDGFVIGVVSAKLNSVLVLKATGDLPQNVNYAIKSNYLIELISNYQDVGNSILKPRKRSMGSTEQVAHTLAKSVVHVISEIPDKEPEKLVASSPSPSSRSAPKQADAFPNRWLSMKSGNQFSVRILDEQIQFSAASSDANCRTSSRGEATKDGTGYSGTQYLTQACSPRWNVCNFSYPISFGMVTPSRIEGSSTGHSTLDTWTCKGLGIQTDSFIWIPQQ